MVRKCNILVTDLFVAITHVNYSWYRSNFCQIKIVKNENYLLLSLASQSVYSLHGRLFDIKLHSISIIIIHSSICSLLKVKIKVPATVLCNYKFSAEDIPTCRNPFLAYCRSNDT